VKDLRDTLPDRAYDWECPLCGELHDTEEEALACCQSWAERDPEGWKDYLWGREEL
jgi:hypothetical protein